MQNRAKISTVNLMFAIAFCLCMNTIAQTIYPNYVDGKIWVKLNDRQPIPTTISNTSNVIDIGNSDCVYAGLAKSFRLKRISSPFFKSGSADLSRIVCIEFSDYNRVDELLVTLERSGNVVYAEKEPMYHTCITPNDPNYSSQWALAKINAPSAWDISTGSANIVVAVVDNAIQSTHPDLQPNIWLNPGEIANDGIDNDNNGYIDDINGYDVADKDNDPNPPNTSFDHGTHVSGIISAKGNNSIGVASIGYNVRIMCVKVTRNTDNNGVMYNPTEGIYYAALNKARVINCSFGVAAYSASMQAIIDWAYNTKGCIIVGAAGNGDVNVKVYPGAGNNVVCVAASGSTDTKSAYSTYGYWVDVSAPGDNIYSTLPTSTYGNRSGSSMATPMVSGLLGLILSVNPNLTQQQAINCLKSSATNIDGLNPSYAGMLGTGRIDALAALQCAQATVYSIDASVIRVTNVPSITPGITCQTQPTMQVRIRNTGTTALTSLKINYQIDNITPGLFNWSGNLASGTYANITLPTATFPYGNHAFVAYCGSPNGGTDPNPNNDTAKTTINVVQTGLALPFTEGFEGTSIPNGWTLGNPDGEITWMQSSAAKYSGSKCIYIDNYNDPFKAVDYLITPALDISTTTAVTLSFQVAYRLSDASPYFMDTLAVLASSDCGATFSTIYKKGGSALATLGGINTSPFVPAGTVQWRKETINITGALGASKTAFFTFMNYGSRGNNLYIDDINISGMLTTGVKEIDNTVKIKIYPNPNTGNFTLNTENLPTGNYLVELVNIMGQRVYSYVVEKGEDIYSEAIELNHLATGIYMVKIIGESGQWVDKFLIE